MTQTELIAQIAEAAGVSRDEAGQVLDALASVTMQQLRKGEKVIIPKLFTVSTVERSARKGHNPRTGEAIEIAARTGVKVTPAAPLKRAVQG